MYSSVLKFLNFELQMFCVINCKKINNCMGNQQCNRHLQFPGNQPGAVAPGAIPVLWSGAGSTTSWAGRHQLSIKNPIFVVLNFCSPFLKMFIEEAWTIRSGKLFHPLTTLFEKKYFRISLEQLWRFSPSGLWCVLWYRKQRMISMELQLRLCRV